MNLGTNNNVKCTVKQCKHHTNKDHCDLNCVTIGSHGYSPSDEKCTDCLSFERK